ncbi:hypothetical protein WID10_28205 [Klebsiella variicola]|uniref:hypothetical protein n=1 Tax=Klebsiella variicola TaxID=244366 RepID=UPI00339CA14F
MNVLFPVKIMSILNALKDNAKWQSQIHYAEHNYNEHYPKDGMTRVALMAPQLMHVIPIAITTTPEYFRVRLTYTPDFIRVKYITLEIYDVGGKLLQTVPHSDWNTMLSLAIETEMLEILLDINPW